MLLIPTALQLLRIYAELIKQVRVLLRIDLIEPLQLLRSLLVIATELADQIHDLVYIEGNGPLSSARYGRSLNRNSPRTTRLDGWALKHRRRTRARDRKSVV